MPSLHTKPAPRQLPFHAGSFGWDHFERFCAAWFVSGASLPNLTLFGAGPSRLSILDAVRYGTAGAKQRGIDLLLTMENQATWVVQCKHTPRFSRSNVQTAIGKAEAEYGPHHPAHWLLWVTGQVSPDALDLVREQHPGWTLWNGERISQEFLLHTPRRQAFQIIESIFGADWAKDFFPLPDSLLITTEEFFSCWAGEERLFHHRAAFVGRQALLDHVTAFGRGGKGSKALILSAAGGIGKTRLLRAAAERIEAEAPERVVRFTNPDAPPHAEPPRYEDAANLTVLHDDAHRLDTIPPLLVGIMAKAASSGARLILATRPGAEDALRALLMDKGWPSPHIETRKVGNLTRPEMRELAAACLGSTHPDAARPLADLSGGCALITLVGAELLRRGDLNNLDLVSSDHFRTEVFHRFEGQELERLRGSLDRPLMEKLLRALALLSPWPGGDAVTAQAMADFLGIQRGQVDAACDSLLSAGLLVRTRDGYRLTPDLFSDHLAYSACYDAAGQSTPFIRAFRDHFAESSPSVLQNLAEAEWRALQLYGSGADSVIAPLWRQFLDAFSHASFWQRSVMLERWAKFAFYQPARSLELAGWAMESSTAPPDSFAGELDEQAVMLERIPALLVPVATWSDAHRHQALDLLWRLRRDFPSPDHHNEHSGYRPFAAVAGFDHNFPAAANGVLDWLEHLLAGPDAALAADRPCPFIETVLRPYFARCIEQNDMPDRNTFVLRRVPISVSKTKAVRRRAFRILTEQIIPRGTVAAINGLPVLGEAFHSSDSMWDLNAANQKAWLPEQREALAAVENVAKIHQHALVHQSIRRLLMPHVAYGEHAEWKRSCGQIIAALNDDFEYKLARFTLSSFDEDLQEHNDSGPTTEWMDKIRTSWDELGRQVCGLLVKNHADPPSIHEFLTNWIRTCAEHGLTPRMDHLLFQITRHNIELAHALLEQILNSADSLLADNAASLLGSGDDSVDVEAFVVRGLGSSVPGIVRSFLDAVHWQPRLRSDAVREAVISLLDGATCPVIDALIALLCYPAVTPWLDDLVMALLRHGITDRELISLTEAVHRWIRSEQGDLAPAAAAALIGRLGSSVRIEAPQHRFGFIFDIARRYPRLVFQMFLKRVEYTIGLNETGFACFEALPYAGRLPLEGIETEADYEQMARDLLDRVRESKPQHRWIWGRLFAMTVSMTSPLLVPLLMEWLAVVQSEDELNDLAALTGFEGSLVIYQHTGLTEAILRRARAFGPQAFERISWALILRAGPKLRTYTGSVLDPEHRYLREEAEKAARTHQSHPLLGPFFQKALEQEIRDADWMRRIDAEDEEAAW